MSFTSSEPVPHETCSCGAEWYPSFRSAELVIKDRQGFRDAHTVCRTSSVRGAVLPDHEIEELSEGLWGGQLLIHPYDSTQLAPSSYDIRLAHLVKVPEPSGGCIDLRKPIVQKYRELDMNETEGHLLKQGGFVLGSTEEWVNIPDTLVCRVEGKSSLARPGLQIHSAGFVDPGYQGNITLEITNFGPDPIWLWPGVLIAQLCFEWLSSRCRKPYEGRYQGSHGTVTSRYNRELTETRPAA